MIEDGTTSLDYGSYENAFAECPIETLYIGRNISQNSSYATFSENTSLKTLTLGSSVYTIGPSAFSGSTALNSVTIHGSLISIGASAFQNCSTLPTITIPATVTSIGNNAFSGCTSLAVINNWNPVPQTVNANVFTNVNRNTCVLNVPVSSLTQFVAADVWKDLINKQTPSPIFTFTFDAQGGTVTPASMPIIIGQAIGALPMPTRNGDIFDGWFTLPFGEEAEYTATTEYNINGNTTLYANWITTGTPEVISVTVSPSTATVAKGATQQFTADVDVIGGASTTVEWTVNSTNGSSINADGLLMVAVGETAETLTVTATSEFDSEKYGFSIVTVSDTEPDEVISVTVSPSTATVAKGATQQFTAEVEVTGGASTAVEWSVKSTNGSSISAAGLLTVAAGETANSLTVTATSVFDPTKKGMASVIVEDVTGTEDILNIDVQVYPNPFNAILYLTGADGCVLKVFTESSVTVHTQKITSLDETIRLEHLPAGIYIFRLERDGKTKTIKVVKMN